LLFRQVSLVKLDSLVSLAVLDLPVKLVNPVLLVVPVTLDPLELQEVQVRLDCLDKQDHLAALDRSVGRETKVTLVHRE